MDLVEAPVPSTSVSRADLIHIQISALNCHYSIIISLLRQPRYSLVRLDCKLPVQYVCAKPVQHPKIPNKKYSDPKYSSYHCLRRSVRSAAPKLKPSIHVHTANSDLTLNLPGLLLVTAQCPCLLLPVALSLLPFPCLARLDVLPGIYQVGHWTLDFFITKHPTNHLLVYSLQDNLKGEQTKMLPANPVTDLTPVATITGLAITSNQQHDSFTLKAAVSLPMLNPE